MPRRTRRDKPGRLHHAVNRGQDRQKIFHRDADYRFFLALLACAVLRGRIRLHAYCLMPNHFHLLVESVDGKLSETMQWIQGRYAAYFNATHEHTGHVFEGRFRSYPITSVAYLLTLIRYIDRNPIRTKRPRDPLTFCWCSAFQHARPGPRPRWLARGIIDHFLPACCGTREDRVAAYRRVFRIGIPDRAGDDIVAGRMAGSFWVEDELDLLLRMGPGALGEWLKKRATSDAPLSVLPVMVDAGSVMRASEGARDKGGVVPLRLRGVMRRDALGFVVAGLLRDLSACTFEATASLLGVSTSCVYHRVGVHRTSLLEDEHYLRLVGCVTERALALAYGAEIQAASRSTELAFA